MINGNTKVTGHRPRFISREDIEDNIRKEPCHEAYTRDCNGNFTLKEGK